MTKYYKLDTEKLKDAEFKIIIGSKGDKYKGVIMNKEQIKEIVVGIWCLIIITKYNDEFTREMLNKLIEQYSKLEGDEYKYLYVKAIQVDKMLALGLNAKEMLENDLKSWEKWEKEI